MKNTLELRYDGDQFYPLSGKDSTKEKGNIVNVTLSAVGPADLKLRHRLSDTKRRKLQDEASKMFRERISTQMIPRLRAFRPDIIFVSAGFDAHHRDFYHFLTTDDYRWITTQLCDVANEFSEGRLISVLEGGYQTKPPVPKHVKKTHGTRSRKAKEKLVDEVKEEKNVQLSPLAECVEAHVRAILESNEKE